MAHTGIFATSAEVLAKCGQGVSAAGSAEANINQYCAEAESYINVLCRYNFSDNYAAMNADVKKILTEACSCLAAIYIIQYDPFAYRSQRHAENLVNINWARFENCLHLLNTAEATTFIKGA
jgi:hypothetical protein